MTARFLIILRKGHVGLQAGNITTFLLLVSFCLDDYTEVNSGIRFRLIVERETTTTTTTKADNQRLFLGLHLANNRYKRSQF